MIFCACDADENDEISKEEIKAEDCVAIQQSIFHDNYLTVFNLDVLTLDDANTALTDIIDKPNEGYNKFFTKDNGKIIPGRMLGSVAGPLIQANAQWCVLPISVPLGVGQAPVENSRGS